MFNNYPSLVQFVKEQTSEKEESRIEEEISLFQERGWEHYVLFLSNLLPELRRSDALPSLSKSALDSYFLYKAENGPSINHDKLRDSKAKSILLNDALRLDINLVGLKFMWEEKLQSINDIIESNIKEHNLFSAERLNMNTQDKASETLILSTSKIPEADINIIMNEKTESTKAESEILRKYLLIRITINIGI